MQQGVMYAIGAALLFGMGTPLAKLLLADVGLLTFEWSGPASNGIDRPVSTHQRILAIEYRSAGRWSVPSTTPSRISGAM